ncbi:hypothetical protein UFOVP228_47 [uncultured Caudovirales phage]|uniref:Uncharacterized protein n=1 Tax=uncultured Caudovirales phage TaxID=2100421 RepID=A0A6J5TC03_9CAUD|nr:hypothetical protein UFOVP47_55 [uncultured Caudovirales phage]CAB5219261.1 hypothetical protein UFOVP228_47 [uncultured Caudovirales phage]
MRMYVYLGYRRSRYMHVRVPLVIETNLPWALAYWAKRKASNININWEIK